MKVHLQSVGCRLNRGEVESLARRFAAAGHAVVDDPGRADVCVLNTCAVTAAAVRKSERRIKALARANPGASIAAAGCCATLAPGSCADLPNVAWVVPNGEKEQLVDLVAGMDTPLSISPASGRTMTHDYGCHRVQTPPPDPLPARGEGEFTGVSFTRAFVKVQDGCDNHCTYCVVRLLRGRSRSRPPERVVAEVQSLVETGYREVVLTGVNLGSYGRDLGLAGGLRGLIEALLARTGLARLRLSSLEPWDVDEGFIRLWDDERMGRHLHLPVQAGCDETLRRMGRRITTGEFARLVETARAAIPDLAVTTDVIVGFPGESEDAFRASRDFVAAMGFAGVHVFGFSPRPGTPAARLAGRVGRDRCGARARAMRELGAEQADRFRRRFVGRRVDVLWERSRNGLWRGLTGNYLRVVSQAREDEDLHNRITPARLLDVQDGRLVAEVVG